MKKHIQSLNNVFIQWKSRTKGSGYPLALQCIVTLLPSRTTISLLVDDSTIIGGTGNYHKCTDILLIFHEFIARKWIFIPTTCKYPFIDRIGSAISKWFISKFYYFINCCHIICQTLVFYCYLPYNTPNLPVLIWHIYLKIGAEKSCLNNCQF